jgi:hypothetical protein
MFIENVGQFADGARFQVRGDHAILDLADDGLWITLIDQPFDSPLASSGQALRRGSGHRIKLSFVGANSHPRLEPLNYLDTHVSYFVGSDPAKWRADVPVWGGVRYVDLYPGVDLEVRGDRGRWAWQLAYKSDCQFDLQKVALRVEGADSLTLESDRLRIATALGQYTLPLLQVVGAADANLDSPTITGDQVALPFASAIPNPQSSACDLIYSTFLGGSDSDEGTGIAVDGVGSAYVTGYTLSSDLPTTMGAFNTIHDGDWDAFVIKVNADGTGLAYATFLGGSNADYGSGIAVDRAGNAYVTGWTGSSDFPTTAGSFDTSHNGKDDAFVVKVNAGGTGLAYATFLGGSSGDGRYSAIAVDGAGNTYMAGWTESSDFPTTAGALDISHNGGHDAFVAKIGAGGVTPTVRVADGSFDCGETGTSQILVSIANDPDEPQLVHGVEVYLSFDPTLLQVVDTDEDPANGVQIASEPDLFPLDEQIVVQVVDNENGTILFAVSRLYGDGVQDATDATIATITWEAAGDCATMTGEECSEVSVEDALMSDADGYPITVATRLSGQVCIQGTGCIAGSVHPQGRNDHSKVGIIATDAGGNTKESITDADGNFVVCGLRPGTYEVQAKVYGYLDSVASGVEVVAGETPDMDGTKLLGGDVAPQPEPDNVIDILDVSYIAANFRTNEYEATADVNGDGVVNIQDLTMAAANFGCRCPTEWSMTPACDVS